VKEKLPRSREAYPLLATQTAISKMRGIAFCIPFCPKSAISKIGKEKRGSTHGFDLHKTR
jgi:hypothetical protein